VVGEALKKYLSLFSLALIVRLTFLWYWTTNNLEKIFSYDPYVDLAQYILGWSHHASELVLYCVSPGYAVFCATVFYLRGFPDYMALRICNILFSSATVVLTMILAKKFSGERASWFTGFLMAVSPALIFFSPHLQSESFYLFFQMGFFLLLLTQDMTGATAYLLGCFGGVITLIRSIFIAYLPILLLCLWFQRKKPRHLFLIAFMWLGMVTFKGWAIHDMTGKFIPLTAQGGQDLYLGIARHEKDRANRMIEVAQITKNFDYDHWIERNEFLKKISVSYIKEHPFEYFGTIVTKAFRYWRPWPYAPYPILLRVILGFYYCVLFCLALLGFLKVVDEESFPIIGFFLTLTIIHAIFDTTLRYRLPLEPFLIMYAGISLGEDIV